MGSIGVKARQQIEKRIAAAVIADLLEAGYEITVNDGEEDTVERSDDPAKIAAAMMTTDEDYLIAYLPGIPKRAGWVRFIYGNDGPDVVNDYTTNLETVLTTSRELADQLEEELYS